MDKIDKVLYERDPKPIKRIDVREAYLTAFKGETGETILRDLIQFTSYGTNSVPVESNMYYYLNGMQSVIKHIKDVLNTEVTREEQEEDDAEIEDQNNIPGDGEIEI